jgi:Effector-associated domain 11
MTPPAVENSTTIQPSKNIMQDSSIQAHGNVHLGDDIITGNQTVQVIHNYYGEKPKESVNPSEYQAITYSPSLKKEIEAFISDGKTEKALKMLLAIETLDEDDHQTVVMLSGNLKNINQDTNRGLLTNNEAKMGVAKVNYAILELVGDL